MTIDPEVDRNQKRTHLQHASRAASFKFLWPLGIFSDRRAFFLSALECDPYPFEGTLI